VTPRPDRRREKSRQESRRRHGAEEELITRQTREVLEDHLRLRSVGDLETDLERNYADDVVVLCELGTLKGRAAIRNARGVWCWRGREGGEAE
jgi:hypothetical protein